MSITRHCEIVPADERKLRARQALAMAVMSHNLAQIAGLTRGTEVWRQENLMMELPRAMRMGCLRTIQAMIDLIDPQSPPLFAKTHRPLLCMAADEAPVDVVRYLLDRGEDPNQEFMGLNALCGAVHDRGEEACGKIRLLVDWGARFETPNASMDAFMLACCASLPKQACCLVECGAVDDKDLAYLDRALVGVDLDRRPQVFHIIRQAVLDRWAAILDRATVAAAGAPASPSRL